MLQIARNYYNDNKYWLELILKWFMIAVVVGGLVFFIKPSLILDILNLFQDKFGPEPARNTNLALQIFYQNSLACAIAIIGGLILGILPVAVVFMNGFIIGFIILTIVAIPGNPGHNLVYLVLGLAPHGIFELPAFFIASAIGLRLGTEYLRSENKGKRGKVFWQDVKRLIYSAPVIAVLLFIAAFIEVFVSGHFVDNFH